MSEFKVFKSIREFIAYRDQLAATITVGFVPTMGALHSGHASLLEKSQNDNDLTVLSIFVNPTQFNNAEDLNKYPRTYESDIELAKKSKADVLLYPEFNEIYPDNYKYKINENDFSKFLCGAHRPDHFDGVLTVVMKLLQIVRPNKAYFGEKDYQQLYLIKEMSKAFFLRTEIVGCETIREKDGLAMSSRNTRLSEEGRKKAALIYKNISEKKSKEEVAAFLAENQIQLEYLEEHSGRRFIAAFVDNVRLIDNVSL